MSRKKPQHKTSGKISHKTSVTAVEKIHRSFIVPKEEKDDESEYETSDKVLSDKRHYCTHCKRKRDQSFMEVVGRGAFGKDSWACIDRKTCMTVKGMKS